MHIINTKRGVYNLTNIKCSYNCIFQSGGFCNLQKVKAKPLNTKTDCIYYEENK